jgi:hypothetical protein
MMACALCGEAAQVYAGAKLNIQTHAPIRAFHFALRHLSLSEGMQLVDTLKVAGFNTIQVMLTTGVQFKTSPWTTDVNPWSPSDFKQWVFYARKQGFLVVPEIKLLTHQEKHFFQGNEPTLMYEKDTYDPRNPIVYKKVFALLNELIDLIHPVAIHIGHDELTGWNQRISLKRLFSNKRVLPASLFLQDVQTLHDFLNSRGIETWMWGDMLVSASEFPDMNEMYLHGSIASGYGEALRKKMPKDIVICDWHYQDKGLSFGSLKALQDEGFRVIGVSWKKDDNITSFSAYAAKHHAFGMMATSWYYLSARHAKLIEHIISFSGRTFLKDFPDAK